MSRARPSFTAIESPVTQITKNQADLLITLPDAQKPAHPLFSSLTSAAIYSTYTSTAPKVGHNFKTHIADAYRCDFRQDGGFILVVGDGWGMNALPEITKLILNIVTDKLAPHISTLETQEAKFTEADAKQFITEVNEELHSQHSRLDKLDLRTTVSIAAVFTPFGEKGRQCLSINVGDSMTVAYDQTKKEFRTLGQPQNSESPDALPTRGTDRNGKKNLVDNLHYALQPINANEQIIGMTDGLWEYLPHRIVDSRVTIDSEELNRQLAQQEEKLDGSLPVVTSLQHVAQKNLQKKIDDKAQKMGKHKDTLVLITQTFTVLYNLELTLTNDADENRKKIREAKLEENDLFQDYIREEFKASAQRKGVEFAPADIKVQELFDEILNRVTSTIALNNFLDGFKKYLIERHQTLAHFIKEGDNTAVIAVTVPDESMRAKIDAFLMPTFLMNHAVFTEEGEEKAGAQKSLRFFAAETPEKRLKKHLMDRFDGLKIGMLIELTESSTEPTEMKSFLVANLMEIIRAKNLCRENQCYREYFIVSGLFIAFYIDQHHLPFTQYHARTHSAQIPNGELNTALTHMETAVKEYKALCVIGILKGEDQERVYRILNMLREKFLDMAIPERENNMRWLREELIRPANRPHVM